MIQSEQISAESVLCGIVFVKTESENIKMRRKIIKKANIQAHRIGKNTIFLSTNQILLKKTFMSLFSFFKNRGMIGAACEFRWIQVMFNAIGTILSMLSDVILIKSLINLFTIDKKNNKKNWKKIKAKPNQIQSCCQLFVQHKHNQN